MAQSIEVTEKVVNGKTHTTPVTKSYIVDNIESHQGVDSTGTDDTLIFLKGRGTKDLRRVDENYAAVLVAINTAPAANVEKTISLTVKAKQGDLESNITPYLKGFQKNQIVEFQADPNDANDSIITIKTGENNIERIVYTVDETYASIKASYDA